MARIDYEPPAKDETDNLSGWHAACPYASNARNTKDRVAGLKPAGKHFVSDVTLLSDLCRHPYNAALHGITLGQDIAVGGYVNPVFSLSKTALHSDILAVPVEQWVEDLPVVPWAERTSDRLMWRGSNTGMQYTNDTHWQHSHRIRAINLTRPDATGFVDVLPPPFYPEKQRQLGEAVSRVAMADLNKKIFDVGFAGSPIRKSSRKLSCLLHSSEAEKSLMIRMRRGRRHLSRTGKFVRLYTLHDDHRRSFNL